RMRTHIVYCHGSFPNHFRSMAIYYCCSNNKRDPKLRWAEARGWGWGCPGACPRIRVFACFACTIARPDTKHAGLPQILSLLTAREVPQCADPDAPANAGDRTSDNLRWRAAGRAVALVCAGAQTGPRFGVKPSDTAYSLKSAATMHRHGYK